MSGGKEEFLETLFHAHAIDLASVDPRYPDHFVCPICFNVFPHEVIYSGALSDGHVWPEGIREKSGTEKIRHQHVLLCTECNNRAGTSGDKQMQLREAVKDAEKKGELFGDRKVEVIRGPAEKPIRLQAQLRLEQNETIQGKIIFPLDRTGEWARNNPKEHERFEALGRDNPFSMIVYPFHELKPHLAEAGWITSAYLLAFFTFGYRCILNGNLDRVREYILRSFTDMPDQPPKFDDFGIQECKSHFYQEPVIGLVIPLDGKTGVHLEISLFDYHVRLPFHHYVPQTLWALIQRNEEISKEIPRLLAEGARLYAPIDCKKMDGHECLWDYVLGKPIPGEV